MKKVLSALLAVCMLVVLGGCGQKAPTQSTEPTKSTEAAEAAGSDTAKAPEIKGEISFSTWGSLDEKKVNEEIIKAFEAKHPGTKVNLEYIPDKYKEKIDTMFIGGNAPDVMYGHPHQFVTWANQGLLLDLSGRFKADEAFYSDSKFAISLYDAFKDQGKNIATINGHDTFLLYYNKDMFDKAGIAYPDDKWTWDDFIKAAQALTDTKSENKVYGIIFNNYAPTWFPYIYSFGGRVFDDMNAPTKVTFNSPETVEALTFIQDAVHKYKIAPAYQDNSLLGGSFDTGRVAMDIEGSWSPLFRKNIEDFKWDMANVPLASDKPRATSVLYAGYCINKNTKNPDLAYEFAKFFQEDEGQTILSKLGLITVINKDIASKDENLRSPGMPDHIDLRVSSVDYAINGYAKIKNWDEMVAKGFTPSFDKLMMNQISPAECAAEVQAALEPMLAEALK